MSQAARSVARAPYSISVTDWPYLFAAADRHGVRMLLLSNAEAVNDANVPERWREVCEEGLQKQAEQKLFFAAELARLLRLLEATESKEFLTKALSWRCKPLATWGCEISAISIFWFATRILKASHN